MGFIQLCNDRKDSPETDAEWKESEILIVMVYNQLHVLQTMFEMPEVVVATKTCEVRIYLFRVVSQCSKQM